jgi:3(or 17)beta-hydroxysteroid dehydrogenase
MSNPSSGRLKGKVALVTGGARGIGLAAVRAMANQGAKVLFCDVLDDAGQGAEAELKSQGLSVLYHHLDVTSEAEWAAAVQLAGARFGGVDVLLNNAGIYLGKSIEEVSIDEWLRLCDVNLTGPILGIRAALPSLRDRAQQSPQGSVIINMSSVAGIVGTATDTLYSLTKGGITTLTKALAIDFGQRHYRVRVNSVHPGAIETEMGRQTFAARARLLGQEDSESGRTQAIAAHPIGRLGQADDIAQAIVYLASDESGFVTGSSLVVDGGFTAR